MTTDAIKSAAPQDVAAVADVLTLAFSTDPAARWTWADPRTYLATFPLFARAFGGQAFQRGTAYFIEGYKGAALWLPPGAEPDEAAMGALMQETVPEHTRRDTGALIEQMMRYHPKEPHWYLPLIGIDPAHQDKGLGSALMRHALAKCDRDGSLAYLESSNPANVPFYQRHGFELLGTIQAGSSPELFPMLRKPQRRT
ncbi:MAG: GNAT family N-acetyltransferase [Alphaproteobacteria bacterium RIFCSPHIGHO2_12_FULL_66_14]|nr:MAG: GNAT family N-acetyltransferase [Alphaproteobacteria bacterium RIFCSPHIGHO2_12_FULL_66_14]